MRIGRPSKRRDPRPSRTASIPGRDWLSKLVGWLVAGLGEVLKLGREMLVIPAQIWMLAAELAGGVVLRAWRVALLPALLLGWRALVSLFGFAERALTPARAVAAVAVAAAIGLAASQWLDLRSISIGSDAYSGVEAIAPPPEIAVEGTGDAHSWVMVPIAGAAILIVALALAGRAAVARLLVLPGAAAVAIALIVDAPKGLDEGPAALAYQGARANLLEGFWVEVATGAVLIACGLLLPRYLRAPAAGRSAESSAGGPGAAARLRRGLSRLPRLAGRPRGSSA